MGAPYTSVTIADYNTNPPSDDGSQTEANRGKYATVKTKLSDPVRTLAETINSNILAAFGKVIGGGGVTATAISYQVLSTDQGKLVRATASGITVTTPSATDVDDPFVFGFLNNSAGNVTLDGSGAQTINGSASLTIGAGDGVMVFTDGTNWFTTGGVVAGGSYTVTNLTVTATLTAAAAAGGMIATKAQEEAAVVTSAVTTPGTQQFHPSACKAWVKFQGSTGAIDGPAYNVSSITRNAVGDYTVLFDADMATANFCSQVTCSGNSGAGVPIAVMDRSAAGAAAAPSTAGQRFAVFNAAAGLAAYDPDSLYYAVFGVLA